MLLGSYVLVERLGAGGMGEVFKARNWKLGKTVALKLVRAERLTDPDAVRRFQREVRAAAQLNHANVVHAYDCDEAGGKHFLVMEYVEGVDLARFVKQHGPLTVRDACDYVRQAALGLQHAFERGLVHRDVKPHNLLLSRTSDGHALIKVLDMGLARLNQTDEAGEAASIMTQEGVVMGTLDYIAPEQARNAHTADTRADLYSLGCTLYYLLAGRVPFPVGSSTEKLLRHQFDQPTPLEQLRPDVPPAVAAIARRLMAKRPEERYQTPAEAAAALTLDPSALAASAVSVTQTFAPAATPARAMEDTAPSWSSIISTPATVETSSSSGQRRAAKKRRWMWPVVAGLAVILGLIGLLLFHSGGTTPATTEPPSAVLTRERKEQPAVQTFDDWLRHVADLPADRQVEEVAVRLKRRNPGFDGAVKSTIEKGVVVRLEFGTDRVTDISPVRALPGLKQLDCRGSAAGKGRLSDLSPLKGMRLSILACGENPITDLSPLKDMPLTALYCTGALSRTCRRSRTWA